MLGFEVVSTMAGGKAAFLRADGSTNDHDLGLFELGAAGRRLAGRADQRRALPPGLGGRHARATSRRLAARLADAGALVGASDHSTTKSLYGHDPDGLEFEIAWVVPADRLDDAAARRAAPPSGRWTCAGEIARYGADTPAASAISRAAPAAAERP